ncbi:hypothetical protein [Myxococcus sp. RHSTA-1-4]|uniref:hypothetical protein n=1 Tax=Myxococcus sp. RHSTA-1-4 TaxID=2874601 RepID=UPI001CBC3424|nr:hypothetical protein [Myxococcus sp. RHSTA-1-4]MBZ4416288.1 hypothetical protein [Myxococcus sp. RHSTA-1-4]
MTIHLDTLKEKARAATREALARHPPIPDRIRQNLTLGVQFSGEVRIFELYVPAERPENAIVLARVAVNSITGEVGQVDVYPERWCDEPDRKNS